MIFELIIIAWVIQKLLDSRLRYYTEEEFKRLSQE